MNKPIILVLLYCFSLQLFAGSKGRIHKIDSLNTVLESQDLRDTNLIKTLHELAYLYEFENPDSALILYKKTQKLCDQKLTSSIPVGEQSAYAIFKAQSLRYSGIVYRQKGKYPEAIDYYNNALQIVLDSSLCQNKKKCAKEAGGLYNSLGILQRAQGEYSDALQNYLRGLKIFEQLNDKENMSLAYTNIGVIQYVLKDYRKALVYHNKSLEIEKEINDNTGVAQCYTNIGAVHYILREYDKALDCFKGAISRLDKKKNKALLSKIYINLGNVYKDIGNLDLSLDYYHKAYYLKKETADKKGVSLALINLSSLYNQKEDFLKAIEFGEKSLQIAESIQSLPNQKVANVTLATSYEANGDYAKALMHYKQYHLLFDSIFNSEKNRQIVEMEAKYENEKKMQELEKKDLLLQKQDAEMEGQRFRIYILVAAFFAIIVFATGLFRSYRIKRRSEEVIRMKNEELMQQNEEIAAQRDLVMLQKEQLSSLHNELTDSILYAKRIQSALLPSEQSLLELGKDFFIVFKPKDIVSGDFYWATKVKGWLVFAVADCTGHGVPGAFMSMLGIAFLNEIVRKEEVTQANHVLNLLRKYVIKALNQQSGETTRDYIETEVKDGMDISLCAINETTGEMQYAGANNSLYIVKSQEADADADCRLKEVKPDKMPVSVYAQMKDFSNHTFKIEKGDQLYLFSDGMPDQFGGDTGKKFMYKSFRRLITQVSLLPMEEQKVKIEAELLAWMKAENKQYDQIDDITILGIKW